jgi:hypothetical protein
MYHFTKIYGKAITAWQQAYGQLTPDEMMEARLSTCHFWKAS